MSHITAEQRNKSRAYGNYSSITKNMQKVKKTMNKEERNKFVGMFPSQLERFILHMHLIAQGLLMKPRKKDRLVFDAAHLVSPSSVCINNYTNIEDEIKL